MSNAIDFETLPTASRPLDVERETTELNERLLTRAYAMVAEAERMIAEQRNRIKVLESLSFTDELTGALNRRAFDLALARELGAAQRDPAACGTVILIDLDGFKLINDRFGHAAGDAYLAGVSRTLRGALRAGDTLARLGGDEFAIILPRCRATVGARRAAQLQSLLQQSSVEWDGMSLPLRASFGPASFSGGDDAADIIKRADARLYSNKAARKGKRSA